MRRSAAAPSWARHVVSPSVPLTLSMPLIRIVQPPPIRQAIRRHRAALTPDFAYLAGMTTTIDIDACRGAQLCRS
jgi:hypothetical protein